MRKQVTIRWGVGVLASVVAIATTGSAQANEFEVDESNVPAYKRGAKLQTGTRVTFPDNAKVIFIERTANGGVKLRECSGKYEGPVESCTVQAAGGSKFSPGATRGVTR